MLDILKKLDAVENKSKVTECGPMPSSAPSTPVSVNLSAPTAHDMAQMLRALANIESGEARPAMAAMPMAMAADAMEAEYETDEEFINEPDEEYADHKFMTKDLSGGINREKNMYKPAAKGDNPMSVESIKDRLYRALNEKNAKPDFLDMDKDGNKKEPMKKAVADKKTTEALKGGQRKLDVDKDGKLEKSDFAKLRAGKDVKEAKSEKFDPLKHVKNPTKGEKDAAKDVKRGSYADRAAMLRSAEKDGRLKEASKPDFLDMDKDGNKKEPMKKAVADKKKNPFAKK